MNHILHIPLPGDTLTRAEKRRETVGNAFAENERNISLLAVVRDSLDLSEWDEESGLAEKLIDMLLKRRVLMEAGYEP